MLDIQWISSTRYKSVVLEIGARNGQISGILLNLLYIHCLLCLWTDATGYANYGLKGVLGTVTKTCDAMVAQPNSTTACIIEKIV